MPDNNPMMCPDCGVAMNHHADKIDYNAALDGAHTADADLGGVVEQAHTCPACGQTQMRPAGEGA